jgi:hypothetical protein
MNVPEHPYLYIALSGALVLVGGCPNGDGGGVLSTTAATETAGGTGTFGDADAGDAADETADETGTPPSEPCRPDPSSFSTFPTAVDSVAFNPTNICGNLPLPHLADDPPTVRIYIYRPDDSGDWPNEPPRPAMFFVPGAGQFVVDREDLSDELYDHVFDDIVAEGIPVFAGQPFGTNDISVEREALLACIMTWAKTPVAEGGWSRSNDGLIGAGAILAGHSRGGAATNLLVNDFDDFVATLPAMSEYELCAATQIAPRWAPAGSSADTTPTEVFTPLEASVPLFVIQGAFDEDTIGQGLASFDAMASEDLATATAPGQIDPTTLSPYDKMLLWVYGVRHNDFGGRNDVMPSIEVDRADATGPTYLARFLRWQLFGDVSARSEVLAAVDAEAPTSAFPPSVQPGALWSEFEPQFSDHGRPLVVGNFTQGITEAGAERLVVDTMARGATDETCAGDPVPAFPSDSTLGLDTAVDGLVDALVCQGPATSIAGDLGDAGDLGVAASLHETEALVVGWGNGDPGGAVTWSLQYDGEPAVDVSSFTHLSFRVANLVEVPDGLCAAADSSSFDFLVELETETPEGLSAVVAYDPGPAIQQSVRFIFGLNPATNACAAVQAMRTIRIPLTEFCGQGQVDLTQLVAVRLVFPDSQVQHHALIDSIEFTRDPNTVGTPTCPTVSAAWGCEVTAAFDAIETSCAGEPTPSCAPTDRRTTELPAPIVADGLGPSFSGWVVHTPSGWVADPANPTPSERSDILGQCQAACALEWSDAPFVTANCHDPSAWKAPVLRATPSIGPESRIPASAEDGSGIFSGQSLTCNLEADCCEAFDEAVCAARSRRPTPATLPLARGEEQRLQLGTAASKVEFITPAATATMPLTGTMGYSMCTEGETGTTCPFHLGSLTVTGTSPATIVDTCPDASTFAMVVSDLDIELLQPAMGIADASSYLKGFPKGALHLQGNVTVDGKTYTIRGVNEEPFTFALGYFGMFAADLDIGLTLPCGADTIDMTIRIDLRSAAILDEAPIASIDTPDEVSCPTTLTLDATAVDPDDDLASVRWFVDDVLVSQAVSSIPMTTDHELRLVVRDARGATTTVHETVRCG